jgi:hypothetical protein
MRQKKIEVMLSFINAESILFKVCIVMLMYIKYGFILTLRNCVEHKPALSFDCQINMP